MRKFICLNYLLLITLLSLTACSTLSDETIKAEEDPINCRYALRDVEYLKMERSVIATQVRNGNTFVVPKKDVVRLIGGNFEAGVPTSTEEYDQAIKNEIGHIRRSCTI